MTSPIVVAIHRWAVACEISVELLPSDRYLVDHFGSDDESLRPPQHADRLRAWEHRHDVHLPPSLRAWLLISNGFYRSLPLVHPLEAIGPMVLFGELPGIWVQPESWFELGNPNVETIGVDLAYHWPDRNGDCPIITSGDRASRTSPKVIATGFAAWFLQLLEHGGAEFWLKPGFQPLGDAWLEHRHHAPRPTLPSHLSQAVLAVERMMIEAADERNIAQSLDLDILDIEQILRYLQHRSLSHVATSPGLGTEVNRTHMTR